MRASSMVMVVFSVATKVTSAWVPASVVWQALQTPQPRAASSGRSHTSAAAKAKAALERPEPGGPVNNQACVG